MAEARALENVISFHQDYLTYKPPLPPPLPLALVAKAYKERGAVLVRQGPDSFVSNNKQSSLAIFFQSRLALKKQCPPLLRWVPGCDAAQGARVRGRVRQRH